MIRARRTRAASSATWRLARPCPSSIPPSRPCPSARSAIRSTPASATISSWSRRATPCPSSKPSRASAISSPPRPSPAKLTRSPPTPTSRSATATSARPSPPPLPPTSSSRFAGGAWVGCSACRASFMNESRSRRSLSKEERRVAAQPAVLNEAEGWEAAVWTHARMLYRIAYAVLHNHHDAEDAAQEPLPRAWKDRHRRASVETPAAWLERSAWQVAKSRRSRPGMVPIEELGEIAELRASGASAEELASNRQLKSLADAYIQR